MVSRRRDNRDLLAVLLLAVLLAVVATVAVVAGDDWQRIEREMLGGYSPEARREASFTGAPSELASSPPTSAMPSTTAADEGVRAPTAANIAGPLFSRNPLPLGEGQETRSVSRVREQ